MKCRPVCALVVVVASTLGPGVAAAQPPAGGPPWHSHGFVSVDAGVVAAASGFTSTVSFPLNAETGTFDARYDARVAPFVGGRAGVRLWGDLAVGIGVSGSGWTGSATVDAQLPHPFQFNQPRAVSGTADTLKRSEIGLHVEVSYRLPVGKKLDLIVFGGPSVLNVTQQLVTHVRFSESYPYDTAAYTGADSQSFSKAAVGFNAGADFAYFLTRAFGVGGLLRYSRATLSLEPVAGQKTTIVAGGVQLGGGVRFRF